MASNSIDAEIRARVDAFVEDLSELIRQSALEAVREALGSEIAVARGRARTSAAPKAAAASGKRIRRSSDDLEKVMSRIVAHVARKPGDGSEAIGKALGISTKELRRPMQMLVAAGQVKTQGQRRGMTYHPGKGGAPKAPAAKKPGRRAKRK